MDQRRGRFRSFILRALQNFLASDWDRRSAQKRDVRPVVSWTHRSAMATGSGSPLQNRPVLTMSLIGSGPSISLDRVRIRLENELRSPDQRHLLRLVPAAIQDDRDTSYATFGGRNRKVGGRGEKAAERLRKRWFQILRGGRLHCADPGRSGSGTAKSSPSSATHHQGIKFRRVPTVRPTFHPAAYFFRPKERIRLPVPGEIRIQVTDCLRRTPVLGTPDENPGRV